MFVSLRNHRRRNPSLILATLLLLGMLPLLWLETRGAAAGGDGTIQLDPPPGFYDSDQLLHLSTPDRDAQIFFTTDGSIPDPHNSVQYTDPVRLSAADEAVTVIRARVFGADGRPGPEITASYFLGIQTALPVISLVLPPDGLWNPDSGLITNPLQKGIEWEKAAHLTFLEPDRHSGFQATIGLRIHGGYTRTYDKKSFRIYFRDEYGLPWLEYPLFGAEGPPRIKRLVLHSGAQDSPQPEINWSLMRNQVVARIAAQTDSYTTLSRPVHLFINGAPWGIYQLRERVDERFLQERFGIGPVEMLDTPELSENRLRDDQPRAHWDALLQFVETHDLADPDHYAFVATQVDFSNLIDYTLIQIYSANIDWPHRNMNMFRPLTAGGQWHWLFWDNDSSLGLQPWSTPRTNMIARALATDHPNTGGRDTLLLRSLMANPDFRARFLGRAADLLNFVLTPEQVTAHIDLLAAELAPDILYETSRWQQGYAWESGVADLRRFAAQRPGYMRSNLTAWFQTGPMIPVTIMQPADGGQVFINGWPVPAGEWTGLFFPGLPLHILAVPANGLQFTGWEGEAASPSLLLTPAAGLTLSPRYSAAPAHTIQPGDVTITAVQPGDTTRADQLLLRVVDPDGVDLRGWLLTDNDSKTAGNEGTLRFADHPALQNLPAGTELLLILPASDAPAPPPADDLQVRDGHLTLYAGNGILDIITRSGFPSDFALGPADNIALLAPGPENGELQTIALVMFGRSVRQQQLTLAFELPPQHVNTGVLP